MLKKARKIKLDGIYDEAFYNERVSRSLCFLGIDEEQRRLSQEKLANATVGVAGCGGIGSYLAVQLARMGVRHLKLADPDHFDASNINRQLGSGKNTVGRNKAMVVGEMVHEMTPDVTVEIYPDGIQRHTAEDFVEGCDLLLDMTDFYLISERYALHRAYRASPTAITMLCACVWGWASTVYKFDKDGVTYEDLLGIPEDKTLDRDDVERLIKMQANYFPRFPGRDTVYEWMEDIGNIPILGAVPPIACGYVAARSVLALCDLEKAPYCEPLPPIPAYYLVDTATFDAGFYAFDGDWANDGVHEKHFAPDFDWRAAS
ncbi:ThiF family adenylyltransferase [Stappia sp. MMSF_3263]|uniref:HesA/MoeB/ThiF family protein n=1 Tax=Stappia sp. MMSF_3263 TaxID=3046693 RepID=UPI00273FFC98|nr:ThiF family adenylyltransferase [Stappia sp. MMSF_3263]